MSDHHKLITVQNPHTHKRYTLCRRHWDDDAAIRDAIGSVQVHYAFHAPGDLQRCYLCESEES